MKKHVVGTAVALALVLVPVTTTYGAEPATTANATASAALLYPVDVSYSPMVFPDQTRELTSFTPFVSGVPNGGGSTSLRFTVTTTKTSTAYVATCTAPAATSGVPTGCSIPEGKLKAGTTYFLNVMALQGSATSPLKNVGTLTPDKDVSAIEAAGKLEASLEPDSGQGPLTASEQDLATYYAANEASVGATWTGTTRSPDGFSSPTTSAPVSDQPQTVTFTPDETASTATTNTARSTLAGTPIVCTLSVQNPHGSKHGPAGVNAVSVSTCNHSMNAIWHEMALYKYGQLVATRKAPTFVTPRHWSQIDYASCRVGDRFRAVTTASYYPPLIYLPANIRRTSSNTQYITNCFR